ncbi:hypothetical protein ACFCV9_03270 [Streptomyces sp. NPDC056367]|uniref:RCC1 domain-containing protein n=1 Tax=Streptomyces sp. NPDC056367 TaxID=3345797 RepID=UPI0035DF8949
MRFVSCGRTVRRRAAVASVAALLWSGLAAGAWPVAQADEGRAPAPGTALAWGYNVFGQLGDGSTVQRSTTPVRVCGDPPCTSPLDRVVAIDGHLDHSVALRADGSVWAWGFNGDGRLGDGTTIDRTTPVQVCAVGETAPCDSFLGGVKAIAAGGSHNLALRTDGTVVAWGSNAAGQLGDGTNTQSSVPVSVSGLNRVTSIAAGLIHSLAARTDGTARGWGDNDDGQLGDGTTTNRNTPVEVFGLFSVTAVSAGNEHSVALRTDGGVISWGNNSSGQLGDGTTTDRVTPVEVIGLTGVTAVSAGGHHSVAARSDGSVRAWGRNFEGQLGNGTNTQSNQPVQVSSLTGVTAVSAGNDHNLALRTNGTVAAWGSNIVGQLGDGTTTNRNLPVGVCAAGQAAPCSRFLDGVGAIVGGGAHSLAIVQPRADLAIALSASPEPVASEANLTYTVTVRNIGPSAAENVVFNDTLPPDARFVSATSSQGTCTLPPGGSTDTVTCSLGTLESGAQTTAQIVVRAVAARGGTVTNRATVASSTHDPNQVNNSATITTLVR